MTTPPTAKETGAHRRPGNRKSILDAGLAEFAAGGFEGASISAIAARSGLNKQLIYHYFGNKRGLYDAVIHHVLKDTVDIEGLGLAELLDTNIEYPEYRDWVRLLGWEGLQYDGGEIPFMEERAESMNVIQAEIEELQRAGNLDARLEPEIVTLIAAMAMHAPAILTQLTTVITGQDGSSPELRRRVARALQILLGAADD